jgi:hypothetical protein
MGDTFMHPEWYSFQFCLDFCFQCAIRPIKLSTGQEGRAPGYMFARAAAALGSYLCPLPLRVEQGRPRVCCSTVFSPHFA